ncbi:ABC transporter permease [Nocardioides sp.]|uniref:ABC transporter permease n=1 Tax=Nocardioides sp. TaxID=35761 RepID=UPI0035186706
MTGLPLTRLVRVELRKMFDTRSGFWLLTGIGVLAVVATVAAILFAPEESVTYATFTAAIGLPMSVILPVIAILAVTSEWSQRSGLTTFTLVPHRGRVIGAKALATLVVGAGSTLIALAVGAVGNLAGSALAGVDLVWDVSLRDAPQLMLGNLMGMAIGFTLGVVLRSSAAALVGYFVVSFVLSGVFELLALVQESFRDAQPWLDWNTAQIALFDGATTTAEAWARFASTTGLWIVLPLLAGLLTLRRAEVK